MNPSHCPQCKIEVNNTTNRLFQDECGHKKCRTCVMQDDVACQMCQQTQSLTTVSLNTSNVSVIKYDASHKLSNSFCKNEEPITCSKNINNYDCTQRNDKKSTNINRVKKIKRQYKPLVIPNHIIIVTKSPLLYKCTICSKSFHSTSNVKYHTYCNGLEKPFKCPDCDKSFVTQSNLEVHSRSHSGLKPFFCDICNKKFSERGKLNRHLKLHSGDFEFVCTECGKKFPTNDGLKSHLRLHTGEKPFRCNQCDSSFSNKSNLNKHLTLHTKEKLYMCEQCGKKFHGKYALAIHKKIHTSHKPFKCENCDKLFASNKDLKRHKIIHSNSKSFSCTVCSTKFRRKDNLDRHFRNTHSNVDAQEDKNKTINTNQQCDKTEPKILHLNSKTNSNISETKLIQNEQNQNPEFKEKPNAIKVIQSSNESTTNKTENTQNAVPVINGPFKLAFKTDTFKHNYNIHNRDYPDMSHIKSYDTAKSLDIFQRILPPINTNSTKSNENIHTQTRNVITSVGKVNEKDSLEICKKILSPLDAPIHYETSFENKTHASIKNIKFKLPSTYTNNAVKTSEQIREANEEFQQNNLVKITNVNYDLDSTGKEYTELKTACVTSIDCDKNSEYQSVIVNPHSVNDHSQDRTSDSAPPFNELHWRKRNTQYSHPKKSYNL